MSGLSGDKTLVARFWAKVDKRGSDECWPWLDSTAPRGYGRFWDGCRFCEDGIGRRIR